MFAPDTHKPRKPVWMLIACPEAALAMRGSPLPPEQAQRIRATRALRIRRAADRHRY